MIKKLCLLLLTASLFLVCANAKTKKKYLALGDSITAGYLLDNPEEDAFASILAKEYDFELTNEAVKGDKSKDLLAKLDNYNINDYDVITLCIGANDVLREFIDKYLELSIVEMAEFLGNIKENEEFNQKIEQNLVELDKNLEKIMSILKKGHAQIYMMNVYNPYKGNAIPTLESIADPYIQKMNKVIEKYAKDVYFVNLYKEFKKTDDKIINSQNIKTVHDPHPNVLGHKKIAQLLSEKYYQFNAETKNIVLLIVFGVITLILECIEILFTLKKIAIKPIIKQTVVKEKEEETVEKKDSSRFIRS